MGCWDVVDWLKEKHQENSKKVYSIKEIAQGLTDKKCSGSIRLDRVRKIVIKLEASGFIKGVHTGSLIKWERRYKYNVNN